MTKLNMRHWKGIVIGLECYECWHDAMAGMWKADNGGWHKMDWCIFFIVLFLVLVTQCLFYCMFPFQLVMRKWTTSTSNVSLHMHECWMSTWYSWFMHGTGFLYNGWILKHVPKQECSQLSGWCINWFVNSSLTVERIFLLKRRW